MTEKDIKKVNERMSDLIKAAQEYSSDPEIQIAFMRGSSWEIERRIEDADIF